MPTDKLDVAHRTASTGINTSSAMKKKDDDLLIRDSNIEDQKVPLKINLRNLESKNKKDSFARSAKPWIEITAEGIKERQQTIIDNMALNGNFSPGKRTYHHDFKNTPKVDDYAPFPTSLNTSLNIGDYTRQ